MLGAAAVVGRSTAREARVHELQDTWKPAGGRPGVRACGRAIAALGTISLVLVAGLPARAATPTRNPLDPIPDPGGDPAPDVLAWLVIALIVVGTIVAVYLVGRLVASVGGTRAERAGAEGRPRLLAQDVGGRLAQFLVSGTAVALGWAAGVGMASAAATGGMATLGIGVLGVGIALASAAVILPALLAFKLRGAVSPAIATLLLAGVLLPLGSVAGAAFGAPARTSEPVVLEALGHVPRVEPSEPDGITWPDDLDGLISWSCEPW